MEKEIMRLEEKLEKAEKGKRKIEWAYEISSLYD